MVDVDEDVVAVRVGVVLEIAEVEVVVKVDVELVTETILLGR